MSTLVTGWNGIQMKLLSSAILAFGTVFFGIVALTRGESVNAAWLVIAAVFHFLPGRARDGVLGSTNRSSDGRYPRLSDLRGASAGGASGSSDHDLRGGLPGASGSPLRRRQGRFRGCC